LALRILLADDFEPWRARLRSMLEAISIFQVIDEARDGLEAIEKARQLLPDIVLLDIGMPFLNGIEAVSQIRRVSPKSKIIFLTVEHDSEVSAAALATGAEGYLLKSNVAATLQSVIDVALGSVRPRQVPSAPPLALPISG
jgi:DNA-binding NarL/FixJ family response regulator